MGPDPLMLLGHGINCQIYKTLKETFLKSYYQHTINFSTVLNQNNFFNVRGQSDKYLASPPERASIAREIYYYVVHSSRRLLSKFQPNQTCSFVFTACGSEHIRKF